MSLCRLSRLYLGFIITRINGKKGNELEREQGEVYDRFWREGREGEKNPSQTKQTNSIAQNNNNNTHQNPESFSSSVQNKIRISITATSRQHDTRALNQICKKKRNKSLQTDKCVEPGRRKVTGQETDNYKDLRSDKTYFIQFVYLSYSHWAGCHRQARMHDAHTGPPRPHTGWSRPRHRLAHRPHGYRHTYPQADIHRWLGKSTKKGLRPLNSQPYSYRMHTEVAFFQEWWQNRLHHYLLLGLPGIQCQPFCADS